MTEEENIREEIDEIVNFLNELVKNEIYKVSIGGGEPFTKSDFPDFVEACLSRDIITHFSLSFSRLIH